MGLTMQPRGATAASWVYMAGGILFTASALAMLADGAQPPAKQPAQPADLAFVAVQLHGIGVNRVIEAYSKLSPPIRVGDLLWYDGEYYAVYKLCCNVSNGPGTYHQLTAMPVNGDLGDNCMSLRPDTAYWNVDTAAKRFGPMRPPEPDKKPDAKPIAEKRS